MKIFGQSFDDLLASAFTKLLWLGLVAGAVWFFLRAKVTAAFWIGYTVASLILLYVMVRVVNTVSGDKVFTNADGTEGNLQDYAEKSAGSGGLKKILNW